LASQLISWRFRRATPTLFSTPPISPSAWASIWSLMLPEVSINIATCGRGWRRLGSTTSRTTDERRDGRR
jgi:hypothetical protein